MFNMFQSFNGFSMFGSSISTYKPYINYTWSNTFQVANKMYSKNIGNSGQNLQLFSGQGVKFNGTNQTIPINNIDLPGNFSFSCRKEWDGGAFDIIIADDASKYIGIANSTNIVVKGDIYYYIKTIIPLVSQKTYDITVVRDGSILYGYIDGVLQGSIAISSFNMKASNIGKYLTNYSQGIITDVYMFTDALTQQEIELYTNNPNKFFQDTRDGVIDNCVLNMPLHGIDKYQVDYSRYALSTSIYTSSGLYNSTHSNTRIALVSQGLLFEAGKTYSINYTFTDNVNIGGFSLYIPPSSNNGVGASISFVRTSSNQDFIVKIPSTFTKLDGQTSAHFWLNVNGTATSTTFQNISIKEISGINEVINYTADCVTLAKQLPYGSQEANFFHTSSGVPIRTGLSPFFESTPYWNNYGNTGYVSPLAISHETFELIIQRPRVIQIGYTKYLHGGNTSADLVVEISNNSDSSGYIRLRKVGIDFALNKWLNTNTMYIAMVCNGISVYIYINGLLVYTGIPQAYTYSYPVKLLGEHSGGDMINNRYIRDAAVRLFKVHTKALTQEDITKNFNEYMAKGLLANFLLDENGNYIKDESNNYIMDI